MLAINKINDNTIEVIKNGVTTTVSSIYYAETVIPEQFVLMSKVDGRLFVLDLLKNLTINGESFTNGKDAVVAANEFVGLNFKCGGSSSTSTESEQITLDSTTILSTLGGTENLNGSIYYQVKARNVGDETEIVFGDRDGSVVMTLISPYNCAVLNLFFSWGNEWSILDFGFNADVQSAYSVLFNQATTMNANNGGSFGLGFGIVQSLEIAKLEGSDDYITLGEFFYTAGPGIQGPGWNGIILQGIIPTPKN